MLYGLKVLHESIARYTFLWMHMFKNTHVNFIVTICNHFTNTFVIQRLRSNEDVRTLSMHTYIIWVYVHHTVICFNPVSNTNNFAIQTTQKRRYTHITHIYVHCMGVYVIVHSLFLIIYPIQTTLPHKRHTKTKVYVHHPYSRTLYDYVHHRTVTIFSPMSSINNFATQRSRRNEDLRTSPIHAYIVWVCTSSYSHYFHSSI